MVLLERAAARLQITLTSSSDTSGPDDTPASEHVHRATLLVAEAAQQLAHVPNADSATPTVAAARGHLARTVMPFPTLFGSGVLEATTHDTAWPTDRD
jgi:hypothetical protein